MKSNWTRPADLRAQVQKLWDKGELLAALLDTESRFPRRLLLKCPTSSEIAQGFDEVRAWAQALVNVRHCRIEMKTFSHRVFGTNSLPAEAWLDDPDDAFSWLGKRGEAEVFQGLVSLTRTRQPLLLAWLAKKPLKAFELANAWPLLLDVVAWLQAHPRPDIYLRQVDIPGVHSKFIEAHRAVLAEWLDLCLPEEAINTDAIGVSRFAARYGFREKPERIRFRIPDGLISPLAGAGMADVALDTNSFAALPPLAGRVFITENETNFLAFPAVPGSVVVFGAGYGWESLAKAGWMANCKLYYWGDIDTHGFAILNQLRTRFPHVESLLMDQEVLTAHEASWGYEKDQALQDLPFLTPDEQSLFDALRYNRIRKNLRLEQEFVGFSWLEKALAKLIV
ncbi:DUF3322 domain-containing protein [Methylomonas sp. MgM2]